MIGSHVMSCGGPCLHLPELEGEAIDFVFLLPFSLSLSLSSSAASHLIHSRFIHRKETVVGSSFCPATQDSHTQQCPLPLFAPLIAQLLPKERRLDFRHKAVVGVQIKRVSCKGSPLPNRRIQGLLDCRFKGHREKSPQTRSSQVIISF